MKNVTTLGCGALLAGILAGLVGCSTDVNARRTIGGERGLEALGLPDEVRPLADAGLTTRLDRGDWTPVEFRVPVDGTVHGPLWKTPTRFDDDQRRAHGLFPTAESALELNGDRWDDRVRSLMDPAVAVLDLALLPVRAVMHPAWTKTQGPSMYKRWHSGEYLAGPMPDAGSDASGDDS